MEKEDQLEIYTIPPNFAEEGTMLSGRIKTRNAVETVILLAVLLPILCSLHLPAKAKLYIGVIVIVPLMIFSVIGVQRESLSAFAGSFFCFLRHRRILTIPDEKYRLEQNRKREKKESEERKNREKRGRKENIRKTKEGENGKKAGNGNIRTGKMDAAEAGTKTETQSATNEKGTAGGTEERETQG